MITWLDYSVADPDALETPAMLLFQDKMNHNMQVRKNLSLQTPTWDKASVG